MLPDLLGKEVRGSDGNRLGRVASHQGREVVVEHGIFRVRSFEIDDDEVASITDGEIYLRRPAGQYCDDAPLTDTFGQRSSAWHSGRRDAEGRDDMQAMHRADREHHLGAQGMPEHADRARTEADQPEPTKH